MNYRKLAILGGEPEFETPIPVGQLYFPSWERYVEAFQGIFEREYYTNQGPLVSQLERQLQDFLCVKHAICVTNATIGLMIVAESMELTGKVIVPAFTFIASAQSLTWSNIDPVFCDVDINTHQMEPTKVEELIDDDVSAIMGVNLWGNSCCPQVFESLAAKHNIKLYFDSAHAFGCKVNEQSIGGFGDAEVFSFHATKVLSATEGGCVCTNDDELAKRIRNIRSSYGAGQPVEVIKTANGRMSEAQAAIALMNLEDFTDIQKNNEFLFNCYKTLISPIKGLELICPSNVSVSNYQYVVCNVNEIEFGLNRDQLVDLFMAENVIVRKYFSPGIHRSIPYLKKYPQYLETLPNTDHLCATTIQLPIGALVNAETVEKICKILIQAQNFAKQILSTYEK